MKLIEINHAGEFARSTELSRVSPREAAVLNSLSEPWSDQEISAALNIAEASVSRVRTMMHLSSYEIAMRAEMSARTVAQIISMFDARITNADIAARLEISTNTVRAHLRTAFLKLGARGRDEAAELWRERKQQGLRRVA